MRLLNLFLGLMVLASLASATVFSSQVNNIAKAYALEGESYGVSPAVPLTIDGEQCWVAVYSTPDGAISGFLPVSNIDGNIITDELFAKPCFEVEYVLREVDRLKGQESWFLGASLSTNLESLRDLLVNTKQNMAVFVAPKIQIDSDTVRVLDDTDNDLIVLIDNIEVFLTALGEARVAQIGFLSSPSLESSLAFRSRADSVFGMVSLLKASSESYLNAANFELTPALAQFITDNPGELDPAFAKRVNPPYSASDFRNDIVLPVESSQQIIDDFYSKSKDVTFLDNLYVGLQGRFDRVSAEELQVELGPMINGILANFDFWQDQSGVSELESKWDEFNDAVSDGDYTAAIGLGAEIKQLSADIQDAGFIEEEEVDLSGILWPLLIGLIVLGVIGYVLKNKDSLIPSGEEAMERKDVPPWIRPPPEF